jgi:hypothetical protein
MMNKVAEENQKQKIFNNIHHISSQNGIPIFDDGATTEELGDLHHIKHFKTAHLQVPLVWATTHSPFHIQALIYNSSLHQGELHTTLLRINS